MAKAKTANGKDVSAEDAELRELDALISQLSDLEAANKDAEGRQYSYLRLLGNTSNDPITKEGKAEYIPGAKDGSWVIPSKKLLLGDTVILTVLGAFKVYEDTIPGMKKDIKSKTEPMRQVVGYWMPEDAAAIPVEDIFDRPYVGKDGTEHILRPVHWAFVYLHKHPEIDDALITFKSIGNKMYKELQKLLNGSAAVSSQLRLKMTHQEVQAKNYDREYLYPAFTVDGLNYDIVDGKVKTVPGGMNAATIAHVIKSSFEMQKEYAECKLVSRKRNLASFVQNALPAPQEQVVSDDEEKPARF